MLFDIFFLGFPIATAICMANVALRDGSSRHWTCAFSFLAYIVFYFAGGREVILYIFCGILAAHSCVAAGGGV